MNDGFEFPESIGQRCVGCRRYSQPGAQSVLEERPTQVKLNPISIRKNRTVSRVEMEGPHSRELVSHKESRLHGKV